MSSSKFDFNPRKYPRIISGKIIEVRQEIEPGKLGDVIEANLVNHSLTGCCLIIANKQFTKSTAIYQLNLTQVKSNIGLVNAQVIWCRELTSDIFKVGFRYIS